MNKSLLLSAALAALALFTTPTTQAQGLGGMLNQAKDKARQAANRAANQAKSDVLNGPAKSRPADGQSKTGPADGQSKTSPADGQTKGAEENPTNEAIQEPLDSPPKPLTAQNQVTYIQAMMADKGPGVKEDKFSDSRSYNYRRLRQFSKIAVPFTWDEAAVQAATTQDKPLWDYINIMSYFLVSGLQLENGPYLKSALQGVKEIHLTRQRNLHNFSEMWYSFNPSTGVLTAALNADEAGNIMSSSATDLAQWIVHSMTKAPKSRIELDNEAGFRYAREHPSSISTAPSSGGGSRNGGSSAKSWTCTWCHQSVTAASRPSLAGCPRNSAHQHAWHN